MKIIVPIATRGRPMRLAGALHSLTTLESGNNEIKYVVRMDRDDPDTEYMITDLTHAFGVQVIVADRPVTLAQSWNECVSHSEWDACAVIADKHLCLTRHWDECIRIVLEDQRQAGCRWNLITAPEETALIMSRKWYDLKKRVFPEYFPFWFAERWQMEVHTLAFGHGIPVVGDMPLAEPKLKTQGLRDLEFWFDFFSATRCMRLQEAMELCVIFGKAPIDPTKILRDMTSGDAWQIPRIPMYYEDRGEVTDLPSPQYREARNRAEDLLTLLRAREPAHAM